MFESAELAAIYASNTLGISSAQYWISGNDEGGYELHVFDGVFAGQNFYEGTFLEDLPELTINQRGGGTSSGVLQGPGSTFTGRFWNSPLMRLAIPDKISFGIAGEWAYFVGVDVNTFNFTILTRGEAGIYYTPNVNVRVGAGSYVSGGVNVSTGLFTGNPSNITASMLEGGTYGFVATGAHIGKASVGISYSPSEDNIRQGFINTDIGLGVGEGAFIGAQYQYTPDVGTIWKWY